MNPIAPANMSYTSLVDEITSYLQRNDDLFINNIPVFIRNAEQLLASSIKDLGQLNIVQQTGISNIMRKPEGWRQTHSIRATLVNKGTSILLERPYQSCQLYTSEISALTPVSLPKMYSDYDYNNYYITPVFDTIAANIQLELLYYAYPKFLSSINQENYWTKFYPQALLYASLINALVFTRNDERASALGQLLQLTLGAKDIEDNNRINDSAYQVKPSTQKPVSGV